MREAAKSMIGFSWAVSLFGVQQLSKMLSPSQPAGLTAAQVDEVSRAVQSHLSGAAAMQFRLGERWTRNLVDVMFDAATGRSLDPARIMDSLDPRKLMDVDPCTWAETGVTTFQQSAGAAKPSVTTAVSS